MTYLAVGQDEDEVIKSTTDLLANVLAKYCNEL